eukprot:CAMPEP_0203966194 /NCGR_PEP_ID=MMETSP0359-20131031/95500_1 /ASSEMBLY_ACC=CAM_ASM_000338 /TAXON_ID=268821 /ORGANISM="Scrippsiella Hangoei, Strain SHTV-5" /LENGTH=54 /DNA_ID=CAMNT_0050903477 /DNA_START=19 /DNA_END=183 /DNA_ORIENTATION=+
MHTDTDAAKSSIWRGLTHDTYPAFAGALCVSHRACRTTRAHAAETVKQGRCNDL